MRYNQQLLHREQVNDTYFWCNTLSLGYIYHIYLHMHLDLILLVFCHENFQIKLLIIVGIFMEAHSVDRHSYYCLQPTDGKNQEQQWSVSILLD
jgi:hypothetical protein